MSVGWTINIYFSAGDFSLPPEYKRKYDSLFDILGPQAGRLSEEKVRNFLMEISELPDSTLDKIWELSDQDKDSFLDRYEFTVAFKLTDSAYLDYQIPDQVVISPSDSFIIIFYIHAIEINYHPM